MAGQAGQPSPLFHPVQLLSHQEGKAMMLKTPILDTFTVTGRGLALVIECPGECERSFSAFTAAFGTTIEYEGHERKIMGLESNAITTPLRNGEKISLLVRSP
jgi:hypothetical protein